MSKFRTAILITGILVMCACVALITYLVLSFSGAIVTDPVELVFKVSDNEKTFDGEPLKANAYELVSGELTKGHRAVVEFTGAQTEVGESESGMTVRIFDENDFEVTKDYAIKVNGGLLTVEQCEVYIRLNDSEVTYNGEKIIFDDYTVATGELASGHCVGAAKTDAGAISVNEILTISQVAPAIFDENGKDVSYNYIINFRMGSVRVIARPVAIKPVSAEKVYDGEFLTCGSYAVTAGSLVSGHYAQVAYVDSEGAEAQLLDAGELEVFAVAAIFNAAGEDVTENYALDFSESATLTVTKRDLTLTAKSAVWEYDGEAHSLAEDPAVASAAGLVKGDEVAVEYSGSLTDSGETENVIGAYYITRSHENYNVTCVPGKLTVTKKKITVQMQDNDKTYDGIPLTLADAQYDSGDTELTILRSDLTGVKNAGEYHFTADFDDNNGNYELTVLPATYVISPLEVTMRYNGSTEKIYDGKPFEVNCSQIELIGENTQDFEVVSATYDRVVSVAFDESFDEESDKIVKTITDTPLNLRYPRVVLSTTGEEVASNNITVTGVLNDSVTIRQRAITISAVNITANEDEDTLDDIIDNMKQAGDFISSSTPLAVGDYAVNLFNVDYDLDEGTVEVKPNITGNKKGAIYNSMGEDVTDCYYFTNDRGVLGSLTIIHDKTTEGETTTD